MQVEMSLAMMPMVPFDETGIAQMFLLVSRGSGEGQPIQQSVGLRAVATGWDNVRKVLE